MGQPVDGKSGCHFVPTFRSQCTIIVYKSMYLVYEMKSKRTKYKCLQCSANIPLFFSAYTALGALIVGFRLIVVFAAGLPE